MIVKFLLSFFAIFLLASCASQEKKNVIAECGLEAIRNFPPNVERQIVNKSKRIEVPDGTMNCSTIRTGQYSSTNCTAGTKYESIPYAAVENVDLNRQARKNFENKCVSGTCLKRYGNTQCKIAK